MPSISPELANQLKGVPELAAVSGISQGTWRLGDSEKGLFAGDPATLRDVLFVDLKEGDYASLGRGDVLVEEREA